MGNNLFKKKKTNKKQKSCHLRTISSCVLGRSVTGSAQVYQEKFARIHHKHPYSTVSDTVEWM